MREDPADSKRDSIDPLILTGRMIKCNRDQVMRSQKKLEREKDPVVHQGARMILLREDENTQPNCRLNGYL